MTHQKTGKQIHFLSGLIRSGNTLLSGILNQNPTMYSSPLSPVCEYLWVLHNSSLTQENVLRNSDTSGSEMIFNNVLESHYKNIKTEIVFDREKNWGTSANLSLIKTYINPNPKIIFTVRPILEILTSLLALSLENAWIDIQMEQKNWLYKDFLTPDDNRCDYLMRPWGEIDRTLMTVNEIKKPKNKDIFHIVEYDDLVNTPSDVMNKIHDFLKIDYYNYNFSNIKKIEIDNDEKIGMPSNTHDIRNMLSKTSPDPKEVLSEYVINKYSNMEFWRNK
jgi:sulfotransferase